MAQQITVVIINTLPLFDMSLTIGKQLRSQKFEKIKLENLSPNHLTIGFKGNNTFIFLDKMLFHNMSDQKELTSLENELNNLFMGAKIVSVLVSDTVNFTGYSIIENGVKKRTKAVVKGTIFLDYGELLMLEKEHYDKVAEFMENVASRKISNYRMILLGHSEMEFMKKMLALGDQLFDKHKNTKDDRYLDGSLDMKIIENELENTFCSSFYDLEGMECLQFQKKRFSFKKDSIGEYLKIAYEELK